MMNRLLTSALVLGLALGAAAQFGVGKKTPVKDGDKRTAGLSGPAPRQDEWKIIGPGGGGTMVAPTISPHDPRLVVEHCDMTGAYITRDGGQSWRMFNLREGIGTFAFDPKNPAVIYAGNAALWRSEDRGATWGMVFPNPARKNAEHMVGDHAEYFLTTDDPAYPAGGEGRRIEAVAVDPTDPKRLYIVFSHIPERSTGKGRPASLYVSEDRGATWARARDFALEKIHAIHIQPGSAKARAVYVIGQTGVYIERGGSWRHLAGPAGAGIQLASVGEANGRVMIYAVVTAAGADKVTAGTVYVSPDGGLSWRAASGINVSPPQGGQSTGPSRFSAIACSLRNAATAYVGFEGLRLGEGREHLFNGIAKTTDGGRNWAIVHQESNRRSPNLETSWIEERAPDGGDDIWFDAPYSLGVAPNDPNVCYATDLFRTCRTTDGGGQWQQVNSVRVGEDRWTTRGLDVTTCYGVHFDPFDAQHVFITYTDIGLFQSGDGGASWAGSTVGIPKKWRNTTYWIAFDPRVKGLLWGAFGGTHDLPRPKMWRQRDPESFKGGVAVSTDGGRHWTPSNGGMPETAVTHILLDEKSPVGERALYACGFGRGVYKSADGGKSWALRNEGIEQRQPFAWRITQADDGTLYLIVARRSERGRIGDDGDGALYKSTDGAEHWVRMKLPAGVNGPNGLTIDPSDNRRLYLSAWGVAGKETDTGGGVFLSTDGGGSWRNIFNEVQHVYDLTISSRNPKELYICGFDSAAYRSIDGGATWARIRGYNFKWGHRVILDPVRPDRIYITTFGGSVWHGPAAGDPRAVEDIVTPLARAAPSGSQ